MVGDGEMRKGGKLLKMHAQRSDGMNVQAELVATTVLVLPKAVDHLANTQAVLKLILVVFSDDFFE